MTARIRRFGVAVVVSLAIVAPVALAAAPQVARVREGEEDARIRMPEQTRHVHPVYPVGVSALDQDKGRTRDNPVRIGGDVPPLNRIKTVAPNFPADAKTGVVILELLVSPAGVVEDVAVKVPISGATEAAVTAAEQWIFEPLMWDGAAAWAVTAVSVPNPWTP